MIQFHSDNPSEIVAAVPYLLGFHPKESLICLPRVAGPPVARIDLPKEVGDYYALENGLVPMYERMPPQDLILVAYGVDEEQCTRTLRFMQGALKHTASTNVALYVNGEQWLDIDTRESGVVTLVDVDRVTVTAMESGVPRPVDSREALASDFVGDGTAVARELGFASDRWFRLSPPEVEAELEWGAQRVEEYLQERIPLTDLEAARLLVILPDGQARDGVLGGLQRSTAGPHLELWSDLSRRSPAEMRDWPLTFAALSAWVGGNGARALVALEQLSTREGNNLAVLVAEVATNAIPPKVWDDATRRPTASPEAGITFLQSAMLGASPDPGRLHERDAPAASSPTTPELDR